MKKKWYQCGSTGPLIHATSEMFITRMLNRHLTLEEQESGVVIMGGMYVGMAFFTSFDKAKTWLISEMQKNIEVVKASKVPTE